MSNNASKNPLQEAYDKMMKRNRIVGIVVGILTFFIGLFLLIRPVNTTAVLLLLASVGFVIGGIAYIIRYFMTPKDFRNGWMLANGIITALLGLMMVFPTGGLGQGHVLANTASRASVFAFMFAVLALSTGINQCMGYGAIKKSENPKGAGWVLFGGIMNIICGVFFIFAPIAMTFAFEWIAGFYMIFFGIILFANACSGSKS